MSGIRAVTILEGYDADGNFKRIAGVQTQTLAFSEEFVLAEDTSVTPPVTRVSLRGFGPSSIPADPLRASKPRT